MSEINTLVARAFQHYERDIFGVAYRMLGDACEADDVVQETFLRLRQTPPKDRSRQLKPWLMRVAINLARDYLRRRSKDHLRGEWLPQPVPDALLTTEQDPEKRLIELQSVRLALLHAAEALTPTQRAVYFLRVVFQWSVGETAAALGITVEAVKTNLHRARATLEQKDSLKRSVDHAVIDAFVHHLAARDTAGIHALLHKQITTFADGGDQFFAARPLSGITDVMHLIEGLLSKYGQAHFQRVWANGQPVIVVEAQKVPPGWAPRSCLALDCENGSIVTLRNIMDPRKLGHVLAFATKGP